MAICRLCENDRELRNSHIISEFLYDALYNNKHQLMGIHGGGSRGWKVLQKGIREPLFCEPCEQHFNKHFETPFLAQWLRGNPLPDPWNATDLVTVQVDYTAFKLFHLSVLFRAGVSTLPTYAAVTLGPHEARLRRLLLDRNAGESWQYPVFGYAVVHHKTKRLITMITQPQRSKFGGRWCYGMMYGGAEWWVCVASDRNVEFEQMALRTDGSMPFIAVPWNEVGAVQDASSALNSASPR